jgi:Zn-dependent M28 family amino/carboxypeptidase
MATRLTFLLVALLLAGCGSKPAPEIQWNQFDGARAYRHVEKLVGFGPRPSGSPELDGAATYIRTQLEESGLVVEGQLFKALTPRGPMQFRNIIGKTRRQTGKAGSIIVIGSHYDTKWMTNITFVGANDGGSSSGTLLEIARLAAAQPDLWFVFFDGEECMVNYGPEDGFWGSKFFVEELKGRDQVKQIKAMILLDMVGDANLNITMPANSDATLVQQVFEAARATGHRDVFAYRQTEILDDHFPFARVGIPAVDLIDFDFGSAPGLNDYWHTDKDSLDKISPRSMEIVGQTTLRLLSILRNQGAAH